MVGMCLARTGSTWSSICRTLRVFLNFFGVSFNCVTKDVSFYTTTSRFVSWIGAFSQERQKLWLPKDDLQDSSSWSSPPLLLLRDIHSNLISQYDCKRSVRRLNHRVMQELVLDWSPRMMSLSSKRILPSHFHSLTTSLRLPLCGMRALTPMLALLPFLHNLRSPSRSCFIVSPSGTLSLSL